MSNSVFLGYADAVEAIAQAREQEITRLRHHLDEVSRFCLRGRKPPPLDPEFDEPPRVPEDGGDPLHGGVGGIDLNDDTPPTSSSESKKS